MLREGMYLQDRYEILALIGSGGMSDVYKARCHKLDRLVAIKVLKEDLSWDVNFVSRFKMEAQAAAGLSHPNIVSVYDVVDEGDLHYIVMELVEGITLKNYIAKKGKLEIREAVGIAIQVAQGIAAAHEQNIIHRDIKPQNVLISRDGKVKVADFGIARLVSEQTQASAVAVGSVHYISPEQARGNSSDARSDIYSLGITMYEMVTGHLPFEGDTAVSVALAHVEEPITRPSLYNPEIPVSLEAIIMKCTEKRPERRYASAADVIADLRRVLIYPEENFVTAEGEDLSADTRPLTQDELKMINSGPMAYRPETGYDSNRAAYRPDAGYDPDRAAYRPEEDGYGPEREEESFRREPKGSGRVQRGIERIMTGAGILVAVVIVAVLLVLFTRLGGLFRSGSGESAAGPDVQEETTGTSAQTLADTEIAVPAAVGLPEDMAQTRLKESTLVMRVAEYAESNEVEAGYVISQDPEEGAVVPKYSTVSVVVSTGNGRVDLSSLSLTGMEKTAAASLLEQNGLRAELQEEYSDAFAEDRVIRYSPEEPRKGDTVTLTVSLGPAPVMRTVPDLYNITEEEARQRLSDANLNPGDITTQPDDTIPAGYVISQSVEANTSIEEGERVSFVVSTGPEHTSSRYVGAINENFSVQSLLGPGQEATGMRVLIRLRQDSEDGPVYRTLMEATTIRGSDLLPVDFPRIVAILPVEYGEVEVVNADTGDVLQSYPVRFFRAE